ncbi:MAG: hypothetical protein H0W43_03570 [Chthoniobacterales bacterium]|nr:hypothetical protein [Chthoniobacterales bacterium]
MAKNSETTAAKSSRKIHIPPITKPAAGAAAGAVVGAMAGPVGAVVGGVIGAVLGRRAQKGKSILPSLGRSKKTGSAGSGGRKSSTRKAPAKKSSTKTAPAKAKKSAGTATGEKNASKKRR